MRKLTAGIAGSELLSFYRLVNQSFKKEAQWQLESMRWPER